MIKRYQDRKIESIWSKNYKYHTWKRLETTYLNQILFKNDTTKYLNVGAISLESIENYEKTTKHEFVAFLKVLHNEYNRIYGKHNPDVLKYLHWGLTSSDIIDTAFSIQINDSLNHLINLIIDLKASLIDKINQLDGLKTIGRTHGKHAEEINFSNRFKLLSTELQHCISKILDAKKNLYGKLQGPVGTSSLVKQDAAINTLLLFNLKEVPFATQVIPRIYYTDTMYSLVLLASVYERFATFIRLSAIDEINEIQESFTQGQTGSSAMPHKNNPIVSENICGLSRYVKSNFQVALDNNNLWWERDISHSSNERLIWPESFHIVCNLTYKLKLLIENLQINKDQISSNLLNSPFNSHKELLQESESSNRFEAYSIVQNKYMNKV